MKSTKKTTVTWNIPEVKPTRSPRTPRTGRSSTETLAERYSSHSYSDTFEQSSGLDNNPIYSDTFVDDSYSDTFMQETFSSKKYPNVDRSDGTDNIETLISATDAQNTTIKTLIETDALETVVESTGDFTDTHPLDSNVYSDTFESSERTKAESDFDKTGATWTSQSSVTDTYSLRTPTRTGRTLPTDDSHSLDVSHVAPGYDGQSYMLTADDTDDDVDDRTLSDDYSYTFEPTEISSHVYLVDPEEVQQEEQKKQVTERAQRDFIQSVMSRLAQGHHQRLQTLSPDQDQAEQDEYSRHYCKKKIKMLKKNRKTSNTEAVNDAEATPHPLVKAPSTQLSEFGLTDNVLERAKLVNIMSAMKKAANQKIHEPRKCEECREKKLQLDTEEAKRAFVLSRSKSLQNRIIDEQVEEHLLRMNTISMVAEIARGLPRPTEQPEKIMDQLLEPVLGKNMMR